MLASAASHRKAVVLLQVGRFFGFYERRDQVLAQVLDLAPDAQERARRALRVSGG